MRGSDVCLMKLWVWGGPESGTESGGVTSEGGGVCWSSQCNNASRAWGTTIQGR